MIDLDMEHIGMQYVLPHDPEIDLSTRAPRYDREKYNEFRLKYGAQF